jgi:hypothetical protein
VTRQQIAEALIRVGDIARTRQAAGLVIPEPLGEAHATLARQWDQTRAQGGVR